MSVALAAASQSAAATRSANIDCLGADYVKVKINLAARVNSSAATYAIVLKESNDTTATNFATWSSSCTRAEDLTNAHQVVFAVDCRTRKRYLNLAMTNGTHTTNDLVTSAVDTLHGRLESQAAGTAAILGSTNDAVVVL
jgi:hypothetical protein